MKIQIITILFSISACYAFSQELDQRLSNYLQCAQYQQALEYIEGQPSSKSLLNQKALCYKSLRSYSKAIEILQLLSEEYPDDVPIKLELANCYEIALQPAQSIQCYDELIKIDSTNTYFHLQKADLLFQLEKILPALEKYREMSMVDSSAYLNKRLGMCFEKLNQVDSALIYYSRALQKDSTDVYSSISKVKMFIKQEDFSSAMKESDAFIARDSSVAQMNALNAFAYYSSDLYPEAAERFEKCRAKGDSSLMVNRGLGISYYFLEDDARARPCLIQAYVQDTTNNNVLYPLALCSYKLGYYQDAINYYTTLLKRNLPNDARLYTFFAGLAKSYEGLENHLDAVNNYSSALQYAESDKKMELLYNLSNLLEHQLNDYRGAYIAFKEYRVSLVNYQANLKDSTEIHSIDEKLLHLDEHIEYLKSKSK